MAWMFHCVLHLLAHYSGITSGGWLHHDSEVSRTDCPSLGTEQRPSLPEGVQKQVVNQENLPLETYNNLCVSSRSFTDDDLHSSSQCSGEKFSNNNKLRPSDRNKRLRPKGGARGREGGTLYRLFVDQEDTI